MEPGRGRRGRRAVVPALLAAVAVGVVAAGCGSDEEREDPRAGQSRAEVGRYRATAMTRCANAVPRRTREEPTAATLRDYARGRLTVATGRRDALRAVKAPADAAQEAQALLTSYDGYVTLLEGLAVLPRRQAQRERRTALAVLTNTERTLQQQARRLGVPACGPLA